jgi:hypothetical protein
VMNWRCGTRRTTSIQKASRKCSWMANAK